MDCIFVAGQKPFQGRLEITEVLSINGERLQQATFTENPRRGSETPYTLTAFVSFKSIANGAISFTDTDGNILTFIPEDNASKHFKLSKEYVYLPGVDEQVYLPDNEGDSACEHDLKDDGENFQRFCTKCSYRKSIQLTGANIEILDTPLMDN